MLSPLLLLIVFLSAATVHPRFLLVRRTYLGFPQTLDDDLGHLLDEDEEEQLLVDEDDGHLLDEEDEDGQLLEDDEEEDDDDDEDEDDDDDDEEGSLQPAFMHNAKYLAPFLASVIEPFPCERFGVQSTRCPLYLSEFHDLIQAFL